MHIITSPGVSSPGTAPIPTQLVDFQRRPLPQRGAFYVSQQLMSVATGPLAHVDVDGDGDLDIIVTVNDPGVRGGGDSRYKSILGVLKNNGDGIFGDFVPCFLFSEEGGAQTQLPLTFVSSLIVEDLDGDSVLDVVMAGNQDDRVVIAACVNLGSSIFGGNFSCSYVFNCRRSNDTDWNELPEGSRKVILGAHDFNGDSFLDIFAMVPTFSADGVCDRSNCAVLLYQNLAMRNSSAVPYTTNASLANTLYSHTGYFSAGLVVSAPSMFIAAGWNKSVPIIALATNSDNRNHDVVIIFPKAGEDRPWSASSAMPLSTSGLSLAFGNVWNDRDYQLIVADSDSTISMFDVPLPTKPGVLSLNSNFTITLAQSDVYMSSIQLVDLNLDGSLDIVFGSRKYAWGVVLLELNETFSVTACSTSPHTGVCPVGTSSVQTFAAAKLSESEEYDALFTAQMLTTGVYVYVTSWKWSSSKTVFSSTQRPTVAVPKLIPADLDQDGYMDLLVFGGVDPLLHIAYQNSSWASWQIERLQLSQGGFNTSDAVVLMDVNSDGLLDILVLPGISASARPSALFQNFGNRNFSSLRNFSFSGIAVVDVLSAVSFDMEHDGYMDLIAVTTTSLIWCPVLNDLRLNSVSIRDCQSIGQPWSPLKSCAVTAGDLNNDGLVDVVLRCESGTAYLVNMRDGVFTQPQLVDGPSRTDAAEFFPAVSLADMNSDAWLDVITTDPDGYPVVYYNLFRDHMELNFASGHVLSRLSRTAPVSGVLRIPLVTASFLRAGSVDVAFGNLPVYVFNQQYIAAPVLNVLVSNSPVNAVPVSCITENRTAQCTDLTSAAKFAQTARARLVHIFLNQGLHYLRESVSFSGRSMILHVPHANTTIACSPPVLKRSFSDTLLDVRDAAYCIRMGPGLMAVVGQTLTIRYANTSGQLDPAVYSKASDRVELGGLAVRNAGPLFIGPVCHHAVFPCNAGVPLPRFFRVADTSGMFIEGFITKHSGAGFIASSSQLLVITFLHVSRCVCLSDEFGFGTGGGGLSITAVNGMTIRQLTVDRCSSKFNAGGIRTNSWLGMLKPVLTSILFTGMLIGAVDAETSIRIQNGQFFGNNAASGNGGAIMALGGLTKVEVDSLLCVNNSAGLGGGCVFASGIDLFSISNNAYFRENHATDGGAVWLGGLRQQTSWNASTSSMLQAACDRSFPIPGSFEWCSNTATRFGGAMYVENMVIHLNHASFVSNQVTNVSSAGGALYFMQTVATITNSFVHRCTSQGLGGAIYSQAIRDFTGVFGAPFVIANTTLDSNVAAVNGGGIVLADVRMLASSSTLASNVAMQDGGALLVLSSVEAVELQACTVINNTAANGNGGAFCLPQAKAPVLFLYNMSALIQNNTAPRGGGGAVFWNASTRFINISTGSQPMASILSEPWSWSPPGYPTALNNVAKYGDFVATDTVILRWCQAETISALPQNSSALVVGDASVCLTDAYNQTVNPSVGFIRVVANVTVFGGEYTAIVKGVANLTFGMIDAPGAPVSIRIVRVPPLTIDGIHDTALLLTLQLRRCSRGIFCMVTGF